MELKDEPWANRSGQLEPMQHHMSPYWGPVTKLRNWGKTGLVTTDHLHKIICPFRHES